MAQNLDGTWMALAAVAAVGATRMAVARGSRANGDDENLPAVRQQAFLPQVITGQRRGPALPQLRQRAELALPDHTLWQMIAYGEDPLADLDFERAVVEDPRRIDAILWQQIHEGMAPVFGPMPPQQGDLYLNGLDMARETGGGQVTAAALASLTEENMSRSLVGASRMMGNYGRQAMRANLPNSDAALDRAAATARRASTVARRKGLAEDSVAWREYADFLEGHKAEMRQVLAEGLPGPAGGGPRMLGGARRMLPGPRGGGGNRGSTARPSRLSWTDHGNWSEAKDPETGGTFKVGRTWHRKTTEAYSVVWFGPGEPATDNEINIGHATTLENGKKRAARAHITGPRGGGNEVKNFVQVRRHLGDRRLRRVVAIQGDAILNYKDVEASEADAAAQQMARFYRWPVIAAEKGSRCGCGAPATTGSRYCESCDSEACRRRIG